MTKDKQIKTRYLFDASFICAWNRFKSIPIYTVRFLRALPPTVVANSVIIVRNTAVEYFREINPEFNLVVFKPSHIAQQLSIVGRMYNRWLYKRCINQIDFFVALIFDEQRRETLFTTSYRKVAIVHDLKGVKDDKEETKRRKIQKYYQRQFDSCNALIAISKYTKNDIQKYYPNAIHKAHVVYNSVVLAKHSEKPGVITENMNFILYVNALFPYKNVITLVKAFNLLKENFKHSLVIVGKSTDYWEQEVMTYAKENNIDDRIIRLENVSDEGLRYLYEHASLFVTTSLHEGFGYTPIEAAMCMCPVISSTCEALPDTTQGLLNYYEPAMDEHALADKIREVLNNNISKNQLADISRILSDLYDPEKQVSDILRIMDGD